MFPGARTPHGHILKAINDTKMAKNQILKKGHPGQLADIRQGEATSAQVQGSHQPKETLSSKYEPWRGGEAGSSSGASNSCLPCYPLMNMRWNRPPGTNPPGLQEPDLPVAPRLGTLYDPPLPSLCSLPGATWPGQSLFGSRLWRTNLGWGVDSQCPKEGPQLEEEAGTQALHS